MTGLSCLQAQLRMKRPFVNALAQLSHSTSPELTMTSTDTSVDPPVAPLSWSELAALADMQVDPVNGPTNAQARLRLFGLPESELRVTLYRDNHAWCPYCQKIWLWLEEKQIPYRIEKVTMFCYGEKESW